MNSYYNFCQKWGEFEFFWRYGLFGGNHYTCMKWREKIGPRELRIFNEIYLDKLEEPIESKRLREQVNKRIRDKIEMINKVSNYNFNEKYACQIWLNQIDFKENLQCSCWQKIYWFHCLVNWIKINNKKSWPNWRIEVSMKTVFVNKTIENDLDTIISVMNLQRSIDWKIHMKNWSDFCQTWKWEVWEIWIIKKKHDGHQICSIKDKKESTLDSAKKLLNQDSSVVNIQSKELKRLNNNKQLAKFIKDDLIRKYKSKIDSIDNELDSKISSFHQEYFDKINTDINVWREEENILKNYIDTKNEREIFKNIESINILENKKEETLKLIQEVRNSIKEPRFITSGSPSTSSRFIKSSNIKNPSNDYSILLSEGEAISNKKRIKIKDSSIQIVFKDDRPSNYYSKLELKENTLCKLKDVDQIIKFKSDSETYNLNEFVILNKDEPTDKVELELTLWKETNLVEKFIKDTEETIKARLQDLIFKV